MSKLKGLAEEYLAQSENISAWERNEKIIEYNQAKKSLEEISSQIKEIAKSKKQGLENEDIKIAYIPVYKKNYNFRKFFVASTAKERSELEKNDGIEINKVVFEKLKEDGKISIDTVQASFEETLMSERVDIKLKEKE